MTFVIPPWEEKVEGGRPFKFRARVPAWFSYPALVRAQCISEILKRIYGFICGSDVRTRRARAASVWARSFRFAILAARLKNFDAGREESEQ
jgi:hypothetical protein